jgi:hypothetical protein
MPDDLRQQLKTEIRVFGWDDQWQWRFDHRIWPLIVADREQTRQADEQRIADLEEVLTMVALDGSMQAAEDWYTDALVTALRQPDTAGLPDSPKPPNRQQMLAASDEAAHAEQADRDLT